MTKFCLYLVLLDGGKKMASYNGGTSRIDPKNKINLILFLVCVKESTYVVVQYIDGITL